MARFENAKNPTFLIDAFSFLKYQLLTKSSFFFISESMIVELLS
jgi:hypothetical protein